MLPEIALLDAIDGEADLQPYRDGFDSEATDRENNSANGRVNDPSNRNRGLERHH